MAKTFEEICSLAHSTRVKDRKECLTRIKELYEDDEKTKELDENSKNKNETAVKCNWKKIIDSVHKLLLSEAARDNWSDHSQIMLKTIKKANRSEVLVNCEDLIPLVIEIFSDPIYICYCKTYLTILVKHILPVRQYQTDMSSDHWKELFEHSIQLYENPDIDRNLILQVISELVKHGCRQTHLALHLKKKIFLFLDKVFQDAKSDPRSSSENAFKVANAVCKQIGPESQMAVCEFGERVMRCAIKLYSSSAKYDWMLLAVRAHHPGGVSKHNNASYAFNWEEWTQLLRLIYIRLIVGNDDKSNFHSDSFVQLACEVSWQLKNDGTCIDDVISDDENDQSQPSKRRRTVIGIEHVVDMLTAAPYRKYSMKILIALVTKYPTSIDESSFRTLMKFLIVYLKSCSDAFVLKQLWELGRVLFELNIKALTTLADHQTDMWDKIWNIALRSDSIKRNDEQVHKFLQSFIKYKKSIDSDEILNLYLKGVITWSKQSIQTLLVFCKHNAIHDSMEISTNENQWQNSNDYQSVKISLLQWVLTIPENEWNVEFPIEDTCELLLGLSLKSWHNINQNIVSGFSRQLKPEKRSSIKSDGNKSSEIKGLRYDLTNMECVHLVTAFEEDLYDKIVAESVPHSDELTVGNVLYVKENRDLLIKRLFSKDSIFSRSKLSITARIIQTAVIAKMVSNLEQWNISQEDIKENLSTMIKNVSQDIPISIDQMITLINESGLHDLTNVLKALRLFYKTRYRSDVAAIIQSSTELAMLDKILELIDVDELSNKSEIDGRNTSVTYVRNISECWQRDESLIETDEVDGIDPLSNESNKRIEACTVLVTFCGMVTGDGQISAKQEDYQKKLLVNLNSYGLTQICELKMATTVLELLVDCELASLSDDVTNDLLELLEKLYNIWHNDSEATKDILNILSKVLSCKGFIGSKVQRQKSISILNYFHKLLKDNHNKRNKTGPMVYVTYLNCLKTIARNDPSFIWTMWNDGDRSKAPIFKDFLYYIQSPFHEVRLRAINCLQTMFTLNNVHLESLEAVFSNFDHAINDLMIVRGESDNTKVVEDEKRNRIASALHMMAIVIYSNAIFRSKALLLMFQFSVDRSIQFDTVKKVVERISTSLKIEKSTSLVKNYLNYLLTQWLEKNDSLDEFPISLIGCTSDMQFYQQYVAVIVPIIVKKKGLENARDFCTEYEITFKEAIEHCFPRLISWLLPHVSLNPVEPPPVGFNSMDIEHAIGILEDLNRMENELPELQQVRVMIESNLESVIITLIKRLHDEQYSTQLLTTPVNYPSSDPPHFKCEDIKRSFKYLEDNVMTTGPLVHLLATEKQDVLQKVLLNLRYDIHTVYSDEYKLKALQHYVYFSMMILEEIEHDYFNEMAAFVIRDICHTMVHFTNQNSDSVSQAACDYLCHLLKNILPKRYEEIQQNLRLIVNSMTPIVKSEKAPHALNVMRLLVVEGKDILEDAIERLDSFPVDDVFNDMRAVHSNVKHKTERSQTLEDEICHFVNTRDKNTEICSIAELEYLSEKLSSKKEELRELYQRLQSTEDYSCSSLQQLICALIQLTASSDLDISLTAAKCLGELGSADLSTMILQPEKSRTKQLSDPMLIFTYRVLVQLSNFLTHSDVLLCTATSKALYIIVSSFWGRKISVEGEPEELKCESSQESLRIGYIRPFVAKSSSTSNTFTIDKTKFNNCIYENAIWIAESDSSHSNWITNITCKILECFSDSYLNNLIPVCRTSESFCRKILPWIIHLIVHTEQEFKWIIYNNINQFFREHFNTSSSGELENNSPAGSNEQKKKHSKLKSVRCMLDVVDFIRSQTPDQCWFELNYLDIAKAAQYCSAYFTSVLYAELWCESLLIGRDWLRTDDLAPIDYICEKEPENGKVLQEILKDACIKIGDPDAIYGCGVLYFKNPSAKLEHYAQYNKWDKVLLTHDIELSLGNKTAAKGLLDALQHSGLQYLLNASVSRINREEQNVDISHQYECAWRLSDWNMPLSRLPINSHENSSVRFQDPLTNDYSLFRYQTLRSFHEHDTSGFKTALKSARINAIKTLRNISLESCKTVYPVLSQLQMLREIEEIYFASPDEYDSIIEKWRNQDSIGVDDFNYIEPILSQRTVFLSDRRMIDNNSIKNVLVDTFLQLAESSQNYGYFQVAARALGSLLKQENLPNETLDILQYKEAVLASKNGNPDLGRRLLHSLILKDSLKPDTRAQARTTYGNWMAETKSKNPRKIIDEYYKVSLQCSEKIENPTKSNTKNKLETQATLAQFADVQYQQVMAHMKSRQFQSLREYSAYTEEVAQKLSALPDANIKQVKKLKAQSSIDKVEEENIKSEKDMYLLMAVEYYIATLKQGDDYELLIFKLVSLWLDNARLKKLSDLLETKLQDLPSYKFILCVPQLAPHMNESRDSFSRQIDRLLKRCALDHPHHTLPVLLSLMNSYKDEEFNESKIKSPSIPEPRVLAARKLIEDLRNTAIGPIIEEIEKLENSLIMLANLKTEKSVSKQSSVPQSQSILRLKNLGRILVPTLSIDVKPNKLYDGIIGVREYADVYHLVGGANAPKRVTCRGTDGVKRHQLVKGDDDLRQDAVMQQVFAVMNVLLRTSKEAIKRKLRVRTYKVVPLSRRSGILEWCDNTVPIGEVLEGPDGLHAKYYTDDYTTSKCKDELKKVSSCSNDVRLAVFKHCCEHLHPVFHYFFLESFRSPEIWFEKRLSYMHSIATTSIIGYILGLGDRHLFNMLIDKSTAEVIHIDFGIAFDQGKTLQFPDIVPFRLSRDIEAAMGASGIEGVFRRSCEETLTVLRHQRGVIITLLQVLLYDPISSWEIKTEKMMNGRKCTVDYSLESQKVPGETNILAERALLQLEQKLQGIEEGVPYSVGGQVEKLIQEARDPATLSQMFWELQPCL